MSDESFAVSLLAVVVGLLIVLAVLRLLPDPYEGGVLQEGRLAGVECREDEACWDCGVMGNGVCGPLD